MALWRTKNKDELNLISKEMAGEVEPEKFLEVYEYIMSDEEDRHVMMFINLHKKTATRVCSDAPTSISSLCKVTLCT
jgi:hypothetical protein